MGSDFLSGEEWLDSRTGRDLHPELLRTLLALVQEV